MMIFSHRLNGLLPVASVVVCFAHVLGDFAGDQGKTFVLEFSQGINMSPEFIVGAWESWEVLPVWVVGLVFSFLDGGPSSCGFLPLRVLGVFRGVLSVFMLNR